MNARRPGWRDNVRGLTFDPYREDSLSAQDALAYFEEMRERNPDVFQQVLRRSSHRDHAENTRDRTLRWGGEQQFSFVIPVSQPPAIVFSSNLLALAEEDLPRTWSAMMQCTMERQSAFNANVGNWQIQFSLFCGLGQTNVRLDKFALVNPFTGAIQVDNGSSMTLAPFVSGGVGQGNVDYFTTQVFFTGFPAKVIQARAFLINPAGEIGSATATYTGKMAALLAPYFNA